ncbi:thymidylate kinase [Anoplolepis gracilipes]|uniref:thymidylate kinase n=1 Tax=Anoplolepis gracilipes TaxID=354296 RepID=UPI003BA01EF8
MRHPNMLKRGALIVLEGCDRAGKSTQTEMLMNKLNELRIPAQTLSFPNRGTPVGAVLNSFLSKKISLPPETAHLLFSANRWESKEYIEKTLLAGITLVIDRYAASGAVYAAANTGKDLDWCRQPDLGLTKPDCVVFLDVSKEQQEQRNDWGKERFECDEFQQRVNANYKKLLKFDDCAITVNANRDKLIVHCEILQRVLSVIQEVENRDIQVL